MEDESNFKTQLYKPLGLENTNNYCESTSCSKICIMSTYILPSALPSMVESMILMGSAIKLFFLTVMMADPSSSVMLYSAAAISTVTAAG